MRHQCKSLDGAVLRWALAHSLGISVRIENADVFYANSPERFDPLNNWAQAGPLFDWHEVYPARFYACGKDSAEAFQAGHGSYWVRGISALHAGCRAILLKQQGLNIDIDEEVLIALGLADDLEEALQGEKIEAFARDRIKETVEILQSQSDGESRPALVGGIRSVLESVAKHQGACLGLASGSIAQLDGLVNNLRASEKLLLAPAPASDAGRDSFERALTRLKVGSDALSKKAQSQ